MKTIKVSEATHTQLDWLVAMSEGWKPAYTGKLTDLVFQPAGDVINRHQLKYTESWDLMGPIIDREDIYFPLTGDKKTCRAIMRGFPLAGVGPTKLIAAARCYVVSKLGETVDVPEEL